VGAGTKISFWHDLYYDDMTRKVAFPTLFGIASVKDTSVANNLEFLRGSNQWNVSSAKEGHDWEVDVFTSFNQVLHSVIVRRGDEEKLWWVPSKKGLFKVKSFFHSLACSKGTRFPWKCQWQTQRRQRLLE
jgi:hypothetical protein